MNKTEFEKIREEQQNKMNQRMEVLIGQRGLPQNLVRSETLLPIEIEIGQHVLCSWDYETTRLFQTGTLVDIETNEKNGKKIYYIRLDNDDDPRHIMHFPGEYVKIEDAYDTVLEPSTRNYLGNYTKLEQKAGKKSRKRKFINKPKNKRKNKNKNNTKKTK